MSPIQQRKVYVDYLLMKVQQADWHGVSDAANDLGAGNIWNGTAYSGGLLNAAFTTNAQGSSGPFWIYIQPSSNGTRFDAGQYHHLRLITKIRKIVI